jgi:hypothetical protein
MEKNSRATRHPGDAISPKSAGAGGNFYFHYNLIRSSVTHVANGPGSRVSGTIDYILRKFIRAVRAAAGTLREMRLMSLYTVTLETVEVQHLSSPIRQRRAQRSTPQGGAHFAHPWDAI